MKVKSTTFTDSYGRKWDAYHPNPISPQNNLPKKKKKIGFFRSLFTLDPGETWTRVIIMCVLCLLLFPLMFVFVAMFSDDARQRYHHEHGFRHPRTW